MPKIFKLQQLNSIIFYVFINFTILSYIHIIMATVFMFNNNTILFFFIIIINHFNN